MQALSSGLCRRGVFWGFGPRGLATARFAHLVLEKVDPEIGERTLHFAMNAVWIRAGLRGVIAAPGAVWFARPEQDAAQRVQGCLYQRAR